MSPAPVPDSAARARKRCLQLAGAVLVAVLAHCILGSDWLGACSTLAVALAGSSLVA